MSSDVPFCRILRFLLDRQVFTERSGDLEEAYHLERASRGWLPASLWLVAQALGLLKVTIVHNVCWRATMLRQDIKAAWRHMAKNWIHAGINILGLAIGMAVFGLVGFYVWHESGWDRFNANYNQIYRIGAQDTNAAFMCAGIGHELLERPLSDVLATCRFKVVNNPLYQIDRGASDNTVGLRGSRLAWVDSTVFDLFSLQLLQGQADRVLKSPGSLVLTEALAQSLFGDENPLGRVLRVNHQQEMIVTGVVRVPDRFHLQFDALGSFSTLGNEVSARLWGWNTPTFVLLPERHDRITVEQALTAAFSGRLRKPDGEPISFFLFPLKDIYLHDISPGQVWKTGDFSFMRLSLSVALAILVLAVVNFINLSTAKGLTRAKEVGLRKVVGSTRRRLVMQFLAETLLYALLALVVAAGLIVLLLEPFNLLMRVDLRWSSLLSLRPLVVMGLGTLLVGWLAGFYPALYLSAFQPGAMLKGEKSRGRRAAWFRRGLLVLQFTVSLVLIIGTLTVYRQMRYMQHKDLGFSREAVLQMELPRSIRAQKRVLKARLLENPAIQSVSLSNAYPTRISNYERVGYQGEAKGFAIFTVDPDYADVYQMHMVQGRFFDASRESDKVGKMVVNETAVAVLGIESPVVGKRLRNPACEGSAFPVDEVEIIGVVRDFHYKSLHNDIWPMAFNWNPHWESIVNIRIDPRQIREALAHVRSIWAELAPGYPFEAHFMEEVLNDLYGDDRRVGNLSALLAVLGLGIAVMGLWGLSTFLAQRRTKEIGIRKVLGAPLGRLVLLLIREFALMVVVSCAVAFPIAGLMMHQWLMAYPYRCGMSAFHFLLAGLVTVLAVVLTVGGQMVKVARIQPIKSLKFE